MATGPADSDSDDRAGRRTSVIAGPLARADPRTLHPRLEPRRDGGMGGVGMSRSVIGYVATAVLAGMPGNSLYPDRVEFWMEELLAGRGFTSAVLVEFHPDRARAVVGEGNHRVAAAFTLGVTHVPARVIRSYFRDDMFTGKGGQPVAVPVGPSPWANEHANYWPTDIHPRFVLADVWDDGEPTAPTL